MVEGGEDLEGEIDGGDDGGVEFGLEIREEFELGGALGFDSGFEVLAHCFDGGHGGVVFAARLGLLHLLLAERI